MSLDTYSQESMSGMALMIDLLSGDSLFVKLTTIDLLLQLHTNCPRPFQAALSLVPQGFQGLVDALDASHEKVRNDMVLLLLHLTNESKDEDEEEEECVEEERGSQAYHSSTGRNDEGKHVAEGGFIDGGGRHIGTRKGRRMRVRNDSCGGLRQFLAFSGAFDK